ncbi:MAG TPA: squalene/phytoene synthase family protein, partial [Candidatus Omnitrophota bacterium]|nr:squalene/phytoene synthase family protein [Candidatus Omnitrophota bacterium]
FKIDKNYISREFMEFQIKRAREFYGKAEKGIKLIQDKRCAFVASIMKDMYSAILDEIEHNDFNVFKKRAVVPLNRKLIIIMKRLAGLK